MEIGALALSQVVFLGAGQRMGAGCTALAGSDGMSRCQFVVEGGAEWSKAPPLEWNHGGSVPEFMATEHLHHSYQRVRVITP